MSAGSLIIVRHGRTAFNARGLLQGRTDNPLDDVGRRQADEVGRYLKESLSRDSSSADIVVICSPLVRAQQTAHAIATEMSSDIVIDDRWIELDYGVYEGMRQVDVPSEIWATWRQDPHFAPEAGETLHAVQQRVSAACDDLSRQLQGRTAVIVTHVSPIKSSIAWALGVDVGIGWRTQLDTASMSRIRLTVNGPVLQTFNETAR